MGEHSRIPLDHVEQVIKRHDENAASEMGHVGGDRKAADRLSGDRRIGTGRYVVGRLNGQDHGPPIRTLANIEVDETLVVMSQLTPLGRSRRLL